MTPPDGAQEEAADWLIRLSDAPDDPVLAEQFQGWLAAARQHQIAWDRVCLAWNLLDAVPAAAPGTMPTMARPATAPLPPPRPPAPTRRRPAPGSAHGRERTGRAPHRWRLVTVAAAAAACLGIWLSGALVLLDADYVTGIGETRTVRLEDGSTVTLAAGSALSARFAEGRRSIELLSGEAYFDVVRDPARPFVVAAGDTKVEVLGTAFDVRLGTASSDVALARGSVRASFGAGAQSAQMTPGDVLRFDDATRTLTRDRVPVDEIGAWREGRLVVVDARLGAVVEQIRRYHHAWIALPDAALADERVTGIYDLRQPDQALGALVEPFGGKVHSASAYLRVITRF